MPEIPLTKGMVATVDEVDFEGLSKFKWFAAKTVLKSGRVYYYAARQVRREDGQQRPVMMHHQVMGATKRVDHIDADATLDNRRSNLRFVTRSQNMQNSRKRFGARSSRFKGVTRCTQPYRLPWQASIYINGKSLFLGYFKEEHNAAQAYNFAADEHFGEYGRMNTR